LVVEFGVVGFCPRVDASPTVCDGGRRLDAVWTEFLELDARGALADGVVGDKGRGGDSEGCC
jgi:hypothetical protein